MPSTGGQPHPLLISGLELDGLREQPDRTSYQRLYSRCVVYVLRHRRYGYTLSAEDGEDIVSQALVDEFPCISDPLMRVEDVSCRLKRALNRVRARYLREHVRRPAALPPAVVGGEDLVADMEVKEVARLLREHLTRAFAALGDRDRDLLIDCYHLERLGFTKRGPSPCFATANGFKVALWRARQRFLTEFERVLTSFQGQANDPEITSIVRSVAEMKPRAVARL